MLINTARGALVETEALAIALDQGGKTNSFKRILEGTSENVATEPYFIEP